MPHKKQEYEDYLKFFEMAIEEAKVIPKYFSKYSNKIYCNHQKMSIYLFMRKLKLTTRGVISFLKSCSDARLILGLTKVPVHTTIVRFANKIKKHIHLLLGIRQAVTAAVDSTGFELESKSYYYRNITQDRFNHRRKTKRYAKLGICIDTDKQIILTYKIRKKLRNDHIDFEYLLKDLKVKMVLGDKGYDSKNNRLFVVRKLKAIPNIPYRITSGPTYIKGKKAIKFDKRTYHQRSKVETVFSVIKRKYGSVLRNKSFTTQQVELISKLITYNLDRKINYFLLLIRGLHQSQLSKTLLI